MLKTIAWKEFRELLPFIALALLAEVYLVSVATGTHLGLLSDFAVFGPNSETIPFVNDFACTLMLFAAGLFALVVGLWQTLWEVYRGTFQFLLHRPVDRGIVIGAKLVLGVVVTLLVAGLPLFYYALWAATPGTHDSPFAWSMTSQDWFLCSQIPLVYLSAFLSGLRPAHWYASRFFPVFACILVIEISQFLWPLLPDWQIAIVGVSLMLEVVVAYAALYFSKERDFS